MDHVPVIVLLLSLAILGFVSSFQPSVKRLADILSNIEENRNLKDEEGYMSVRTRHVFSCRNENENCRGIPRCCGHLQCYWKGGYSPFRAGVCVQCIESGKECQRDGSCCGDMVCSREDVTYFNGVCKMPQASGDCYRDAQCKNKCNKDWKNQHGTCS